MWERNRQALSIVGSINWEVVAAVDEELSTDPPRRNSRPHFLELQSVHSAVAAAAAAEGQLMRVPPRRRRRVRTTFSPCPSNVLLIYTCWAVVAQVCAEHRWYQSLSRPSLLPFKIHFERLCGTMVRPRVTAVMFM